MNLNDFAREITLQEGKKVSISIAQVKEVIRLTLIRLANSPTAETDAVLQRYKGK